MDWSKMPCDIWEVIWNEKVKIEKNEKTIKQTKINFGRVIKELNKLSLENLEITGMVIKQKKPRALRVYLESLYEEWLGMRWSFDPETGEKQFRDGIGPETWEFNGDRWAEGCEFMSMKRHSPEILKEYMKSVSKQQGFLNYKEWEEDFELQNHLQCVAVPHTVDCYRNPYYDWYILCICPEDILGNIQHKKNRENYELNVKLKYFARSREGGALHNQIRNFHFHKYQLESEDMEDHMEDPADYINFNNLISEQEDDDILPHYFWASPIPPN